MRRHLTLHILSLSLLLGFTPAIGVGQVAEPAAPTAGSTATQDNRIAVPRLIKFGGTLYGLTGTAQGDVIEITFRLYKQETDEEPQWTETQRVELDSQGHYTVLLGATQADGLPAELFSSGEARWLGVEIPGQPPQPRTLLVSVPYALRAVEAEKLAGKSISDFVMSNNLSEQVHQVLQAEGQALGQSSATQSAESKTSLAASSVNATYPPSVFAGSTTNQVVLVRQTGTGGGLVALAPQNTALVGHSAAGSGSNGVLGQTGGTNGSGVVGIATSHALSSYQNGVIGFNAGNGSGVAGIASNMGGGVGVYGQALTTAVLGNDLATSGPSVGVVGQTSNATGVGVFGQVSGETANASAVIGNVSAPSGSANGVFGQTAGQGAGVAGVSTATSGSGPGVYGEIHNTNGTALYGSAFGTNGGTAGVLGFNVSTGGAGVAGYEVATSGGTAGVIGQISSPGGVAGLFSDLSGLGLLLVGQSGNNSTPVFTLDSSGNLQISGNLTVNGTKSSTAKLEDGRTVALYAVESPENWFEDFGNSALIHGVAWVPLDRSFAQATNARVTYHVFLTPNGDTSGLYTARKTSGGFEVREHGNGASNVAFDYRIVARRRGYETLRLAEVHEQKRQGPSELLAQKALAKPSFVSPTQITLPVAPQLKISQPPSVQ